jgi:hypothetical protein
MSRYLSNYPDGAENDPSAPWNQHDEEEEPRWFTFTEVVHIAVKASSKEEALERIESLNPRTDMTIEFEFNPDTCDEE